MGGTGAGPGGGGEQIESVTLPPASGHRGYVIGVLLRLLSTAKATNTTVSASAATLRAAWGAGFHPCSVNPNRPTVRDSANAISVPTDSSAPAQRSHAGPPARISTASAQ